MKKIRKIKDKYRKYKHLMGLSEKKKKIGQRK